MPVKYTVSMTAKKSKRAGRPPKPRGKKQSERLGFFVSRKDRKTIERVAKRIGKSVPEFLASLVRREVRRLEESDLESVAITLIECSECGTVCDADPDVRWDETGHLAGEEIGEGFVSLMVAGGRYWDEAIESLSFDDAREEFCPACLLKLNNESWRLRKQEELEELRAVQARHASE